MRKRIGITAGVSLLLCFSITFPSVASENEVSGYSRNISGIQMESRVKNKVDFWAHLYKGS